MTLDAKTPMQCWVVRARFGGLEPFLFGTVVVRHGAPMHERDAVVATAFDRVFPARPEVVAYLQGLLVFYEEAD